LADEEKSLILAEVLKDRVVGKGNEQGNKEKKEERDEEMLLFFVCIDSGVSFASWNNLYTLFSRWG